MSGNYSRRSYQDGETIFSEGDRAGEAFLINAGQVRLEKTEGGKTLVIDTVGKGRVFGEMGVMSDMNRMASAVAIGEVTVNVCHRREFVTQLDALDAERRDAVRFMITYCQDYLPFELMTGRPTDAETVQRDTVAYHLTYGTTNRMDLFDGLDPFMAGLFKALLSYVSRRLPPDFEPAGD